jgi:hypothetical protein
MLLTRSEFEAADNILAYTVCDPTALPYGAAVIYLIDAANPTEYGVTVNMKSDMVKFFAS